MDNELMLRSQLEQVTRERDEARALVDELRGQYQYSVGLSMALEERDQARRERDQARQEADRFRHGCTVEGDFVCPNEYAVSELTAERDEARAERDAAIARITEVGVMVAKNGNALAKDAYRRGAEAMREACAAALMADGLVLSRERAANVVRARPIPEEP